MAFHRHMDSVGAKHDSHWNAPCKGFGKTQDIRGCELFAGKKGTGPPKAGLNLINDQQDAFGIANIPDFPEIFFVANPDTPLALYRFQEHGGRVFTYSLVQLLKIVVRDVPQARKHGHEGFLVFRTPGGGQGAHGLAMKSSHGRDDLLLSCACPGEFERPLDGLGA